ncbi:hypothetical protein NW762_009351 [Fusarium torreyae]|uniref:Peptidase S8/S53 domain-containing protein n=1 Tax=Fusarium torreyae TaxID=1237075 RepID=A0A9W8RWA7_9HYPO|nr:hypothetical protein NW762_009351 [Fusarium torreyae]
MSTSLGNLRRAPTTASNDESDFDLDNEEEFVLPSSAGPGFEIDPVETRFKQDLVEARELVQQLSEHKVDKSGRNAQMMNFVRARKSEWHRTTKEGRNFLHHLAYCDYNRKPSIQWLMARAILVLPHLMGSMDKSKRTPLTVALRVGNEMFTFAACKNQGSKTLAQFTEPLKSECEGHENDVEVTCLHTALICSFTDEESRESTVKVICSFVPEEMFTVTDAKGRTPLHLAVEYERCCKTQVGIVEELLRRGQNALTVEVQLSPHSTRAVSLYQYHEHSRKQGDIKREKTESQLRASLQDNQEEDREREGRLANNSARLEQPHQRRPGPSGPSGPSGPRSSTASMGPPPPRTQSPGPSARRRAQIQVVPTPQRTDAPRHGTTTPQLERSMPEDDAAAVSAQHTLEAFLKREEEKRQASARISEQLKLLYLRTQRPDRASRYLHFQDERDKHLWFDFGPSKRISKGDFQRHFSHLQFDSALQYVAFPQIELDEDVPPPDIRHRGKRDMVFFFNWLQQKGVKHIIKVIVDDLRIPSHSDQAMEEALQPFNVEILDWRRVDLDPLSLSRFGQSLREVHLQWSGRNSVLRSWSEKEGLALIPTLKVINLVQVEGLESSARTVANLKEFEKRLHESWPTDDKPKVYPPKPSSGRLRAPEADSQSTLRQGRSVDPHKWMQCMEEFASYFRQIRALRDRVADPSLKPVEVALIDDGTDITHPDLKGMKFPGKSFHDYQEGSTWRVSPYWDSASGHGTLMARLIHRICPSAIIHVIKLQTFIGEGSTKLQISPDSAVKAIEYAAGLGVQIISMSWTIKPPTELSKRKAFDDAIHTALNTKGILMFCAASDQGKSTDPMYPHGSNPNSFRIGAAKATGTMLDTVGDGHELSFTFPGHEVVVDRTYDDVHDKEFHKFEAHSGSSVANALAAGLAALIIECVRLGVIYTNEARQLGATVAAIRKDDLVKIRERKQMEYALTSIGTNRNTDNKYIEVWDTFSDVAESLKQHEGVRIDQLEVIANLAGMFLRKGVRRV